MSATSDGVRAYWPLPDIGSRWRQRQARDRQRVVEVVDAEEFGFILARTITTSFGRPPLRPVTSRIRRTRWHYDFEPAAAGSLPEETE